MDNGAHPRLPQSMLRPIELKKKAPILNEPGLEVIEFSSFGITLPEWSAQRRTTGLRGVS